MMLIRGLKSNAHNIGAYMNINKIVKDSVSSIKDRYDNTQLNPLRMIMPEKLKVELEVKGVDYDALLASLFKAIGNIKEEDINNVAKLGKLVESSMQKAIK